MKTEKDREPSVLEYAVILILTAIIVLSFAMLGKAKKAAQQSMHLTAFGAVMLAILAGVGIYWLAFVR